MITLCTPELEDKILLVKTKTRDFSTVKIFFEPAQDWLWRHVDRISLHNFGTLHWKVVIVKVKTKNDLGSENKLLWSSQNWLRRSSDGKFEQVCRISEFCRKIGKK